MSLTDEFQNNIQPLPTRYKLIFIRMFSEGWTNVKYNLASWWNTFTCLGSIQVKDTVFDNKEVSTRSLIWIWVVIMPCNT